MGRYETFRRDLRTVLQTFFGTPVPPFGARAPLARHEHVRAPVADPMPTRPVRIVEVVRETADAVTLHLEDEAGRPFDFHPGQFLTLVLSLEGREVRRAYSLCCPSTGGARVAVTVKRVANGRVSNHLVDHAAEGDRLAVLGPSGSFGVTVDPTARRHLALVAGGSGITPMMSIAASVLAGEPLSRVTLLYGNRRQADVVFAQALAALASLHGERFRLRHVLEEAPASADVGRGRLDRATAAAELRALDVADAECFVCGPEPMMAEVRAALVDDLGVPAARIHEERFSSPSQRTHGARATRAQPISIRVRGRTHEVTAEPGQTILEAGLGAGLPMPYSCSLGGCGACKLKLVAGQVDSEEPNCLTAAERADGWVLGCVSRATDSTTVEVP
jgi:ferredoxin-NADP reductase